MSESAERDESRPVRTWLYEQLGTELGAQTDREHDRDQDQRATGPDLQQERRARELEQEDPQRGGYPA
jgi:hypothetical protein